MHQTAELFRIIPKDILKTVINSGDCGLEYDFACFEDAYKVIRDTVPKDFVICDMGCYMAAQSYYFANFAGYIGVDHYDILTIPGYIPPLRFAGHPNTKHYQCSIQDFLRTHLTEMDLSKTYFVASYVPDIEATEAMFHSVLHGVVVYSDMIIKTKGIYAEEILRVLCSGKER